MDTPTIQEIRAWLEREEALGLEVVPRSVGASIAEGDSARTERRPSEEQRAAGFVVASETSASGPAPSLVRGGQPATSLSAVLVEPEIRVAATLDGLRDVLGDCRRCKLCEGRTNIVYGVGSPNARVFFVGEGPGEDEDARGEPFVGEAGGLLTKIIVAMGLQRHDVYIANVVKCRPPNNRDPQPDEIVACEPFLRRQIEIVRPEVLVSLGNFATHALLGQRTPISRLRGQWQRVGDVPLMPTFHPAYLLRNPSDKGLVWRDIQLVMERLQLPLPPARGRS